MIPFFPTLSSSSSAVQRAYRVALGDLIGNIQPFQDGLLDQPEPVILAGLDYDTPWTRDAAINVWNGVGLYWPRVARNTLLAVLERAPAGVRIGGQYWDAILWSSGAWAYYLYTGDREFLSLAWTAVCNSLARFEAEEFDAEAGLFRGPAVYGDGIAAYPDRYSPGDTSAILDWVKAHPAERAPAGYGLPLMALSTNCAYAQAYRVANLMARELGLAANPFYQKRGEALSAAIQKHFWDPQLGTFHYLYDAQGGCDRQEGLGHALALLFDLATPEQAHSVLKNQTIAPAGIPCVWPGYERYTRLGGFGRHSGTVWPFISGFWGEAALKFDRADLFIQEFTTFTAAINRHEQCSEIYHPLTGDIYGGLQECGSGPDGLRWASCARQSWTASAYLRLLLTGVIGLRFAPDGLQFQPCLPPGIDHLRLAGLPYRAAQLDLTLSGGGQRIARFEWNGKTGPARLPANLQGAHRVKIHLDG